VGTPGISIPRSPLPRIKIEVVAELACRSAKSAVEEMLGILP